MSKLLPLALLLPILTACSQPPGDYATRAVCTELRADLPSWSRADTAQSRAEGARFVTTFAAVCK